MLCYASFPVGLLRFQTQGLDARHDRRGFHAKQSGSTGKAEDFSAGLRQRDGQIFTLASLEFGRLIVACVTRGAGRFIRRAVCCTKCAARDGISSRRSRSGGSSIGNTLRR
jgi:hypothetical protein